jgi:putative acetyltransferase
MSDYNFRAILVADNAPLAAIIRQSIEDLNLPTEGTAHSDPTTDNLYQLFETPGSHYFVVEKDRKILGGCGIYPSNGLPNGYAELVRFFLHPEARGLGIGKELMHLCEQKAKEFGYTHLYLESFPEMQAAVHLYKSASYKHLSNSLGNTGHFACNVWMEKALF